MTEIRHCNDDGYFAGSQCPDCGEDGTHSLSEEQRETLSRFLSYALRHDPSDAGIELDDTGWTDAYELAEAAEEQYNWADPRAIAAVVATDPKGRFEVDGNRIRAAYGHSVDVDLNVSDGPVPDTLYHGTAPKNVDAILSEGLQPMNRQKVHLTDEVEEALAVGERHADDPVLLTISADELQADDVQVTKRGKHIYTTEHVPPEYIEREQR